LILGPLVFVPVDSRGLGRRRPIPYSRVSS